MSYKEISVNPSPTKTNQEKISDAFKTATRKTNIERKGKKESSLYVYGKESPDTRTVEICLERRVSLDTNSRERIEAASTESESLRRAIHREYKNSLSQESVNFTDVVRVKSNNKMFDLDLEFKITNISDLYYDKSQGIIKAVIEKKNYNLRKEGDVYPTISTNIIRYYKTADASLVNKTSSYEQLLNITRTHVPVVEKLVTDLRTPTQAVPESVINSSVWSSSTEHSGRKNYVVVDLSSLLKKGSEFKYLSEVFKNNLLNYVSKFNFSVIKKNFVNELSVATEILKEVKIIPFNVDPKSTFVIIQFQDNTSLRGEVKYFLKYSMNDPTKELLVKHSIELKNESVRLQNPIEKEKVLNSEKDLGKLESLYNKDKKIKDTKSYNSNISILRGKEKKKAVEQLVEYVNVATKNSMKYFPLAQDPGGKIKALGSNFSINTVQLNTTKMSKNNSRKYPLMRYSVASLPTRPSNLLIPNNKFSFNKVPKSSRPTTTQSDSTPIKEYHEEKKEIKNRILPTLAGSSSVVEILTGFTQKSLKHPEWSSIDNLKQGTNYIARVLVYNESNTPSYEYFILKD